MREFQAEASMGSSGLWRLDDPRRVEHAERLLARARSEAIDRLVKLAAQLIGVPYAQLSMLTDRQIVAGIHGIELTAAEREVPLETSLCTATVQSGGPLAVEEAPTDTRVSDLPPVTSGAVGAYLGVPVVVGGDALGALCVFGPEARPWSPEDVQLVAAIADAVATELELSGLAADAVRTAVRLDLGFAAANIGSFDWDLVSDELQFDDRLRELFGYVDGDFVPHIDSFRCRLHADDRERVEAKIAEAIERCGEYGTDYRIVLPGGETRWVAARGRVLCTPDGTPDRMIGAAYDTTDTHASGERVARLLETMSSAFFSADREWRFTYVNAQAERLLGRGRDDLLGRVVWEEFPAAVGTTFEQQYRRAVRTGQHTSFEAYYEPLSTWFEVQAWPSPDGLSVFFHDISARIAAQDERARAHERLELLSAAGSRLSATLEVDQVLESLRDLVVPRFGAWLAVAVREDVAAMLSGRESVREDALRVVHVAAAGEDAEPRGLRQLLGRTVPAGRGRAWEEATSATVAQAATAPAGAASAAVNGAGAPARVLTRALDSRGRTIGALVVGDPSRDEADRDLLGDIATRAAVALDNAVLYGAERRAGVALQHFLLPSELPQLPDIPTAARYIAGTAGRQIGGDFYIGHRLEDGRLLLAIGDVMGHGLQAAARMGQLRAVLTAYAFDGDEPGRVLSRVAQRADDLLDVRMATVALLSYDPASRRLTAASAGHPPPLLAPCDAPPSYLRLRQGPPIGSGAAEYGSVTVDLPPASTVVLYTDGLIENRGESLDAGLGRLREALVDVRLPPDAVCDHVLRKLQRAQGTSDDVALLVFSHA